MNEQIISVSQFFILWRDDNTFEQFEGTENQAIEYVLEAKRPATIVKSGNITYTKYDDADVGSV